ncbi:MAG: hypothetical protein LW850_10935 [Planctomycetaceae bacterium]|nr:hypothetical protein [Planctomycetaceae bacterium]
MKAKFAMISSKQCNLYRHFRATCLVAIWACLFQVVLLDGQSKAQLDNKPQTDPRAEYIRANYTKSEVRIRMRDGVELFTSIYAPNDPDPSKKYPILLSIKLDSGQVPSLRETDTSLFFKTCEVGT